MLIFVSRVLQLPFQYKKLVRNAYNLGTSYTASCGKTADKIGLLSLYRIVVSFHYGDSLCRCEYELPQEWSLG